MYALGVDPDSKHAGIALVRYNPIARELPSVIWTGIARAPSGLLSYAAASALEWPTPPVTHNTIPYDLLVVEGQKVYPHSQARPADLITLGFAAGCAMMAYRALAAEHVVPYPHEWKGSIPKEIAHERILARCILTRDAADVTGPHRSHVIDAIGLALWGLGLPGAISQGRLQA